MKKIVTVVILTLFCGMAILSQELSNSTEVTDEDGVASGLLFDRYIPGLLFNTSNILLDLSGYQSGVGVKLKAEDYSLRGLVRLSYESADDVFESELGIAFERPYFEGRVSPYWGMELKGGYSLDKDEVTSDDWESDSVITSSLSVVFGAELYVFDFLSLFAEYSLGGSLSRTTHTSVASGDKTETTNLNYYLGTGLGNSASIGVVIYLERLAIDPGPAVESEDKK